MKRIILRTALAAAAMTASTLTGCVTITNTLPTRDQALASAPAPQMQHAAMHSGECCCSQSGRYAPAYYGAYDPRLAPNGDPAAVDYRYPQYYPQPVDPRVPYYYPPSGGYYPEPQVIYVPVPSGSPRDDRASGSNGGYVPPASGTTAERRDAPPANNAGGLGGGYSNGGRTNQSGAIGGGRSYDSSTSAARRTEADRALGGGRTPSTVVTSERRTDGTSATNGGTTGSATVTSDRRTDGTSATNASATRPTNVNTSERRTDRTAASSRTTTASTPTVVADRRVERPASSERVTTATARKPSIVDEGVRVSETGGTRVAEEVVNEDRKDAPPVVVATERTPNTDTEAGTVADTRVDAGARKAAND